MIARLTGSLLILLSLPSYAEEPIIQKTESSTNNVIIHNSTDDTTIYINGVLRSLPKNSGIVLNCLADEMIEIQIDQNVYLENCGMEITISEKAQ